MSNNALLSRQEQQMEYASDKSLIANLFYIYHQKKIIGPCDIDEIVRLYVTKQIGSNTERIWIKKASDPDDKANWIQYDLIKSDDRFQISASQTNDESHANLRHQLELNTNNRIMNGMPFNVPKEALTKTTSFADKLWAVFGQILVVLIFIVIGFHIAVTAIIILCIWCAVNACCQKTNYRDSKSTSDIYPKWAAFMYLGFIIIPVALTSLINEGKIETWKVMYVTWGVAAFLFSFIILWQILSDSNRCCMKLCNIKNILAIILFITGVSFDGITLKTVGKKHIKFYLQLIFIYPPLAGLFPAIIAAYITNFILQEKFELKCSDNIHTNICTVNGNGCCEIISSWNYRYMFEFIGGLISSIIFVWGLIRFIGFLVANASPRISLFLQRK